MAQRQKQQRALLAADQRLRMASSYATIRHDPLGFVRRELGRDCWWAQRRVLEMLRDHDRVAVASANACGKSFLAALTVPWYLCSRPLGYVVTTGASWTGLEKILWPEIHRILGGARNAELRRLGVLNNTEWKIAPQYGAFAVSTDKPERFGGFRTPAGVYVIVDEASSLDHKTMESIEGICSSTGAKILMIGNPLRPSGPFYDAFRNPAWHSMHISALESPNVRSGRDLVPGLATREWVEHRRIEWGEGSPAWMARVLGQFPRGGTNQLIDLVDVEAAQARWHPDLQPSGPIQIGVDVARFGNDKSIIWVRAGNMTVDVQQYAKLDTVQLAGHVEEAIRTYCPALVCVDDIGVGGGVTDQLRERGHADIVNGINVAEPACDSERFGNLRAEGWWMMRDWILEGGIIPPDRAIVESLTSTTYRFNAKGRIMMEPKEEVKKRLGRSPDEADALMLSLLNPFPKVQLW